MKENKTPNRTQTFINDLKRGYRDDRQEGQLHMK